MFLYANKLLSLKFCFSDPMHSTYYPKQDYVIPGLLKWCSQVEQGAQFPNVDELS